MNLAIQIKKVRISRGISQAQFAEEIGISRGALINYEKGTRTPPINVLLKICEKYEVDLESLTVDNTYTNSSDEAGCSINTTIDTNLKDFVKLLKSLGYPVKNLEPEQIENLFTNAKDFFNYEFFRLGYVQVKPK